MNKTESAAQGSLLQASACEAAAKPKMGGGRERNSNVELLRICLMLCIIAHHLLVHGLDLWPTKEGGWDVRLMWFANCACYIGVNGFMLISGYFIIRTSLSRALRIYLYCSVVGAICYFIHLFVDDQNIGRTMLKCIFLPISRSTNWYINVYYAFFLLAPIFNYAVRGLDKRGWIYVVAALLVVNVYFGWFQNSSSASGGGYNFMQFILMYFLGGFIHKYYVPKAGHRLPLFFGWLAFAAITAAYNFIFNQDTPFEYNNPFMILTSLCFFMFFLCFDFKSKKVNLIATGVFAVYLFANHEYFERNIYEWGYDIYSSGVPGFIAYDLLVFAALCIPGVALSKGVDFAVAKMVGVLPEKWADRLTRTY